MEMLRVFINERQYHKLDEQEFYYYSFCKRQIERGYLFGDDRFERTFDLSDKRKKRLYALANQHLKEEAIK